MAVIALDLGGTKLAGAIFDGKGKPVARCRASLNGRSGKDVGLLIAEQLNTLATTARSKKLAVQSVGISVPGISYPGGRVWAPNIPGWDNYPLGSEIRKMPALRASRIRIPIVIENDRACCILGECWRGRARGCQNAIFLAVGTGIGAGILANGHVLNGHSGTAGSAGWMALDRPFKPAYQVEGCFEHHASGGGLARGAHRFHGGNRPFTAADVFKSCAHGEPMGKALITNAIEFWGMAVANLVSLLNPQVIIFGGGVFGPAAALLPAIKREAARWAQPIAMKTTKLCVSSLGADAALYGAGFLAAQQAMHKTAL